MLIHAFAKSGKDSDPPFKNNKLYVLKRVLIEGVEPNLRPIEVASVVGAKHLAEVSVSWLAPAGVGVRYENRLWSPPIDMTLDAYTIEPVHPWPAGFSRPSVEVRAKSVFQKSDGWFAHQFTSVTLGNVTLDVNETAILSVSADEYTDRHDIELNDLGGLGTPPIVVTVVFGGAGLSLDGLE